MFLLFLGFSVLVLVFVLSCSVLVASVGFASLNSVVNHMKVYMIRRFLVQSFVAVVSLLVFGFSDWS